MCLFCGVNCTTSTVVVVVNQIDVSICMDDACMYKYWTAYSVKLVIRLDPFTHDTVH